MQDRAARLLDRLSHHLEKTKVEGEDTRALAAWPLGLVALARVLDRIPRKED